MHKNIKYTVDWSDYYIQALSTLEHLIDSKQPINYLEIGVYEGRSAFWVLNNILNHNSSSAVLVDPFHIENYTLNFRHNLELQADKNKVKTIKGLSKDILPTLKDNSFDMIFIDGAHDAQATLSDCVFAWRLLKDKGYFIIDDYDLYRETLPISLRPEKMIDAFITAYSRDFKLLHNSDNIKIFQKIVPPKRLTFRNYCRVGSYIFDWDNSILYSKDNEIIEVKNIIDFKKKLKLIELGKILDCEDVKKFIGPV